MTASSRTKPDPGRAMAKICTTEKTSVRQRWIENGLLELMQERKFENITVTDLCQHLDVPRRSFYRYFHDMDDVLDCLMNHTFQDMAIANGALTIELLEKSYDFWFHSQPVLNALATSGMYSKLIQYALKYTPAEWMKDHLASEDLGMDLSSEMNLFVISGLSSLLIGWHAEGFQKTPRQMAQVAYRMLSKALLTHP